MTKVWRGLTLLVGIISEPSQRSWIENFVLPCKVYLCMHVCMYVCMYVCIYWCIHHIFHITVSFSEDFTNLSLKGNDHIGDFKKTGVHEQKTWIC